MGLSAQSHVAQEYSLEQARAGTQDQKGNNVQIYPWMQRMNSHSGEFYCDLGHTLVELVCFTIRPINRVATFYGLINHY